MFPFAWTRGVVTDNRTASLPSSDVTHVLSIRGGCESGFAIADADDGDAVRGPQPPTTVVSSNSPNAILRFSLDVSLQPEHGGKVSELCIA